MGKEILLMFCVAKTGFPSGSKLGAEVLRMHELQTCEIPLLRSALRLPAGDRLTKILERLRRLSQGDCGTQRIQTTVREFLKGLQYYRSYLAHPHLGLPHTTNSMESMGRLLREMFRSSRASSNPAAVLLWATAFIRMRSQIKCNGHQINRISLPIPKL
jgi:hypothetical protein